MLILFKPWHNPLEMKASHNTWTDAFDFNPEAKNIMANINVEHECKDAQDTYDKQ